MCTKVHCVRAENWPITERDVVYGGYGPATRMLFQQKKAFNQRNRQRQLRGIMQITKLYCWIQFARNNTQTSGKYRSTTVIQVPDTAFKNSESELDWICVITLFTIITDAMTRMIKSLK